MSRLYFNISTSKVSDIINKKVTSMFTFQWEKSKKIEYPTNVRSQLIIAKSPFNILKVNPISKKKPKIFIYNYKDFIQNCKIC